MDARRIVDKEDLKVIIQLADLQEQSSTVATFIPATVKTQLGPLLISTQSDHECVDYLAALLPKKVIY